MFGMLLTPGSTPHQTEITTVIIAAIYIHNQYHYTIYYPTHLKKPTSAWSSPSHPTSFCFGNLYINMAGQPTPFKPKVNLKYCCTPEAWSPG